MTARVPLTLLLGLAAGWLAAVGAPGRAPDHAAAASLYRQANGDYDQGRFAQAAEGFEKAIAQDPKFIEAYYNRALAYEMVDRAKALEDWKKFLEVVGDAPDLKWDLIRIKGRLEVWSSRPALPEALKPANYVAADGDYYSLIAGASEGQQWRHFPLTVFLGSAPEMKWQQGAREAYDTWSKIVPMQLVAHPETADIRFGWEESVQGEGHAGEEADWVEMRRRGDATGGEQYAVITVALDQPWSKDEMRAISMHELGHALGIKGHSDSKKDLMFFELRTKYRVIPTPVPYQLVWRSLPKQPSQRDLNTLIRLCNSAGTISRFQ
jgi:predicted Zn-dependent protease